MKNLKGIFTVVALSALGSACGNLTPPNQTSSSVNQASASTTAASNAADQCSSVANITASASEDTLQTEYRACPANTAATVNIYAADATAKGICVFPALSNGSGAAPLLNGSPYAPIATRFISSCTNVAAGGGIQITFSGVNYDSLYIVPQESAAMMANCLQYMDVNGCASAFGFTFSVGKFK